MMKLPSLNLRCILHFSFSEMDTDIAVMVNSGARGNISNIKLASAEIGIMVDINNNEIELPVKSSYKKGLNTLESFIATRGARQGQECHVVLRIHL